ncbi:MAG TPA: metallophosphoesterase [Acetobacteraceae bacterium]|nr:metallophosphoesterase [Acetobacteraceae bacterium]
MRRPRRFRAVRDGRSTHEFEVPVFNPTITPPGAGSPDSLRFRAAPGWLPRGQRVYAIGDIHGCEAELTALHQAIAADLAARPIASALLIHLGDYIDHGPHSAGVIDLLSAGPPIPKVSTINLLGDHEHMLLLALQGDRAAGTDWMWAGGHSTLRSLDVPSDLPRELWASVLRPSRLAFLSNLLLWHREGNYLFVHAGIRPGIPLAKQQKDDLLTIRQPFLFTEQDFGFAVVHGHSTSPAPVVTANRIGIDTGAGQGGMLTCAVLEEDRVGFLIS